jgi:hypothetical protein
LGFLHDTSDSHAILDRFLYHFVCWQNCPTNSPDLNSCDYFLWVSLKENIFPK